MLGDSNVGKSSFIKRIEENKFEYSIHSGGHGTILHFNLDNSLIVVEFFDYFGQEKHQAVYERHYQGKNGVILIYDITEEYSFDSCINYYNERINSLCKKNIKKITNRE